MVVINCRSQDEINLNVIMLRNIAPKEKQSKNHIRL